MFKKITLNIKFNNLHIIHKGEETGKFGSLCLSDRLHLGLEHNESACSQDEHDSNQCNNIIPKLITSHSDLLQKLLWIPEKSMKFINFGSAFYFQIVILPVVAVGSLVAI